MNIKNRKNSFVWTHFDKNEAEESGRATCYRCGNSYKTSGNTSNLIDHLKRAHNIVEEKLNTNEPNPPDPDEYSSTGARPKKRYRCQSLEGCLSYNNIYKENDIKRIELNRSLIDMIACDMQPFSMVSDKGFKMFVNKLDRRYKLPSETTLKNTLLPQRYQQIKTLLTDVLKSVDFVALTTDCWTSSYSNDSYITVTSHFIMNFKVMSAVLQTDKFSGSHTGERLAEYLKTVINNWGLQGKVVAVVSDNAANIKLAIELIGIPHLPCAAHTLNLTVNDSIKEIPRVVEILNKCKTIVSRFKRSPAAIDLLKSEQAARNEPQLKLLQDVATRWNSQYFMIKRILEIKDSLLMAIIKLDDPPAYLTTEEDNILKDVCDILEPFNDATEQLSGDLYVTSSLIISISTGICTCLKDIKPTTEVGELFRLKIFENFVARFSKYESHNVVTRTAAILDPRFKKLVFRSSSNSLSAVAALQSELTNICKAKEKTTPKDNNEEAEPEAISTEAEQNSIDQTYRGKNKIFSYIEDKTGALRKGIMPATGIILLRQYLETPNIPLKDDPLDYWRTKNDEFFNKLISKYLCVPATSVSSERMFSKSGQLLSERRSMLKPKNLNMLLFLNFNQSFSP